MNVKFLCLLAGSCFMLVCCNEAKKEEKQPTSRKPNIVVLLTDDMGYGDLSGYGNPVINTPQIDRMAAEGIRLTSFYVASSVCTPSRAALLTGRYPLRAGLPNVVMPESPVGLRDSEVTMGEAVKQAGYKTMYIGKWHLGDQEKHNPVNHGFDDYYGILYSNDMMPPWVETQKPLSLMHGTKAIEYPVEQPTLTERYTEWGKQFIRDNKDQPFFLLLSYAMPHVPIFASKKFAGKSRGGLYGDVVETIDWSVGEILQQLKDLNLDENTMVVFLSDNGPWQKMPDRMFSNDTIRPWHCGSAGSFRGSKGDTYEGGVRVPAIVRWPGKIPAGKVSADLVTAMDLYPTILNITGAELPKDRKLDGNDIMAFLEGKEASPTKEYIYYIRWDLEGIRVDNWKYHRDGATEELFDLQTDPGEKFNVAKYFPEKMKELRDRMIKEDNSLQSEIEPVPKY